MSKELPEPTVLAGASLPVVSFRPKEAGLESLQVWEYDAGTRHTSGDIAGDTARALNRPDDFPPIDAAIVGGDRVALAVDPNVPGVAQVVAGAIRALEQTSAAEIDIVVWEEATEQVLGQIRDVADGRQVIAHQCDVRDSLCYLAADV